MKISKLLIIALLCITSSAWAYDLSYLGPLKPKETQSIKVHLPAGKLTIEATNFTFPTLEDGKLSCQFATSPYGITVEQANTNRCLLNVSVKDETDITVSISNLENKDSNFKIWVHN